jgi:hypothetical protein
MEKLLMPVDKTTETFTRWNADVVVSKTPQDLLETYHSPVVPR